MGPSSLTLTVGGAEYIPSQPGISSPYSSKRCQRVGTGDVLRPPTNDVPHEEDVKEAPMKV